MQRRTKKFLLHFALESIARLETYVEGLSFDAFTREALPRDATILRLQFLGYSLRDLSKRIPMGEMKNYLARKAQKYNALTEDYRKVDHRKIWETVTLELPRVKRKLQTLRDASMRTG